MTLSLSTIKEKALVFFQEPLSKYHYFYDPKEYSDDGFIFTFVASPNRPDHLRRYIEFQLTGFDENELFDIAINLYREPGPEIILPLDPFVADRIFSFRLSPRIWNKNEIAGDFWWHFLTVEELDIAFHDILEKLISAGIPFLDDPNSTKWDYLS